VAPQYFKPSEVQDMMGTAGRIKMPKQLDAPRADVGPAA
jgi:hypothetical protein